MAELPCVYFVSESVSRFVKVGHTANLRSRMKHYNYSIPGETMIEGTISAETKKQAAEIEKVILDRWRAQGKAVQTKNSRTEWFKVGDADIREMAEYIIARMPVSGLAGLCTARESYPAREQGYHGVRAFS